MKVSIYGLNENFKDRLKQESSVDHLEHAYNGLIRDVRSKFRRHDRQTWRLGTEI